jgi:hypothetical protein
MKYITTNKVIQVGDRITYAGTPGTIVIIIDDNSYSAQYPSDWSYLGKGLGIKVEDETGTLYHLDSPDEDLVPFE